MTGLPGKKQTVPVILLVLLFAAAPLSALNTEDTEFRFWLNLLGAEQQNAVEHLGSGFTEISPELLSSRADRVFWYRNGITLWISGSQISQIRFDSAAKGSISGISMGTPASGVRAACGEPWIESEGSLYYNLPWRSGPARLRFVFDSGGDEGKLREVYLYLVR